MKIGLDIGSTTIKAIMLSDNGRLLYANYQRHFSMIVDKTLELLAELERQFPAVDEMHIAISGSAGLGLAKLCDVPFVQEVYATQIAAEQLLPQADVLIELGGEDAKILFLKGVIDARMNGSCAGGTGAFIDQMATLLKMTPAELNEQAKKKEKIYAIASRCGVFAKSDIQPLLNQGARKEDIAASILYSVVNQTIAGLAQGRPIAGVVAYLGGPLTYMSELRAAFDHVLRLEGRLPENSLYFVSIGTALLATQPMKLSELRNRLQYNRNRIAFEHTAPLFKNQDEYEAFLRRHNEAAIPVIGLAGFAGKAHFGVDAGSTTVKTALIDGEGNLLHTTYQPNTGNPAPLVRNILMRLYEECPGLSLASMTTTGYGEELIAAAFQADYSLVETMAHFTAARHFQPDVDFIIDIGGQDMKCFKISDGVVSDIFLNEACSSGCGSFLQTFAEALGWDMAAFAKMALFGDAPVELGSRCTVFMNSSVKQAQKDGASVENISAGLAISVVKNALYKVIRTQNPKELGSRVLVQGGTFYNDAVLRAFELEMGLEVVRPSIAGLMGAFGAALYGKTQAGPQQHSSSLGREALQKWEHTVKTVTCNLCTNHCTLTVNSFSGGMKYLSGNRCDRPLTKREAGSALNIYEYKQQLLGAYVPKPGPRGKIGIPLGLNLYELLPFWHTLFSELGFEVVTSPPSTRGMYFAGQSTIPSDTVCYPAKLMHGHIKTLCEMEGVDTLFYPCMTYNVDEGISDNKFNCPVVAYYPEVIKASCGEFLAKKRFLYDDVGIHNPRGFEQKFYAVLSREFAGITKKMLHTAAKKAYAEYDAHMARIRKRGQELIAAARAEGKRVIVLAGRPYHVDAEVNHGIDKLIASKNAVVISEDCMYSDSVTRTNVLNQWTYHARMYAIAEATAKEPDIDLVQLVSFGCGLDAVTADEVREILTKQNKLYTQIKIDEIVNLGAVNIRLKSLFAALDAAATRKTRV